MEFLGGYLDLNTSAGTKSHQELIRFFYITNHAGFSITLEEHSNDKNILVI
jgi:hypothetical protein